MSPGPAGAGGPVVVGVDLGTSSVKVVAVGSDGRVRASARREHRTARPSPGAAEQDPGDWWAGLAAALDEIRRVVPVDGWWALGLTAMLPTLLVLDGSRRPVGAAITWQDDRAEPDGERCRARAGADALYRTTGQWVDGRYLLPMAAALAGRDRRIAAEGRYAVGAKDYLFHLLTGELLTDPSTAAGYGCYDLHAGRWMPDLPSDLALPAIVDARTTAPLRTDVAARLGLPVGLPVVLGAADSVLGAAALGATSPGAAAYLCGSSTVILAALAAPRFDAEHRYLVTPTVTGGFAAEMDLLATGSALTWLASLLGLPPGAGLPDRGSGRHRPVFLPYLAPGEQGALWDPELSGAILGLTLAHDRADVTEALVTGIVVESARCLDVLAEAAGAADVCLGGLAPGIARIARDLADATGRAVRVDPRPISHSGYGAAMLAAEAIGHPVAADPGARRVVEPDPGRRGWWQDAAERHDAARRAVRAAAGALDRPGR